MWTYSSKGGPNGTAAVWHHFTVSHMYAQPAHSFVLNNVTVWTVTIISRFKSILSEWTDFCRLWDKGGGRAGNLYRGKGEGRAYVLKVGEGFKPSFNITQHMWQKGERVWQRELLVRRETHERDEKRERREWRRRNNNNKKKHNMAKGANKWQYVTGKWRRLTKITAKPPASVENKRTGKGGPVGRDEWKITTEENNGCVGEDEET